MFGFGKERSIAKPEAEAPAEGLPDFISRDIQIVLSRLKQGIHYRNGHFSPEDNNLLAQQITLITNELHAHGKTIDSAELEGWLRRWIVAPMRNGETAITSDDYEQAA